MSEQRLPPRIQDYAIIGDCRTAALVSRGGSIDWLCLPRFDGPSWCAALLDPERGGRFHVRPVGEHRSTHRYLPGTNVLETTFRTASGTLRLLDAITITPEERQGSTLFADHEILRRLGCDEGNVEVEVVFDPRPGYGARVPRLTRDRQCWRVEDGATAVALRGDVELQPQEGLPGLRGRATLRAGEVRWLSLVTEHGLPLVLEPLGEQAERRLRETADWWREWSGRCSYEGPHREAVIRSALVLKLLAYPPSGAILAAPTTSLPERIGGERNWDYRYCWLRDAAMTLRVLLDIGFAEEAAAFLGWLLHATWLTLPELEVLYDVHGRTHHPERELAHLGGYRGSRPVRVGNGASEQFQLDVYGEVISAAFEFCGRGGELDAAESKLLSRLAETVCERWEEPDSGIWELRAEPRQVTHSKAMCWVALDRLLRLAEEGHVELKVPVEKLRENRDAIYRRVEAEGVDPASGGYTAFLDGGDDVDATLLLLGISGYEDPCSDRMRATLERVRERLGADGLLYRYRYADGLEPPEQGAFAMCSFWEVELLARQGRVEEAERLFDRVSAHANDVGLFSEEIDPGTGEMLGNFPQAFTHVGLISAATALARARGERPAQVEGRPREPMTTRTEPDPHGGEEPLPARTAPAPHRPEEPVAARREPDRPTSPRGRRP